jgi:hypothetical protein
MVERRRHSPSGLCQTVLASLPRRSPAPICQAFTDVNNPKSIMLVDPYNPGATLGPGVTWRSMTIETTDEPLTEGFEKKLP